MSETRIEEAEKHLAAVRTQLAVHVEGETTATDSSAKFQRWGDERRRLELEVERHAKLVEVAQQEDENDRRQELLAKADTQRAANAKIAAWFQKEGSELLQRALGILQKVAEADLATTQLNAKLPPDVAQIRSVDTIARAREALPRKDIAEKTVELWVDFETGNLVSDQTSVDDRGDGIGSIAGGPVAFGRVRKCARRRFRQMDYHPPEQVRRVNPFFQELRLPFFDRPGCAWDGERMRDAQFALNLLKRERSESKREVLVEIIPEGPWTPTPASPKRRQRQANAAGE